MAFGSPFQLQQIFKLYNLFTVGNENDDYKKRVEAAMGKYLSKNEHQPTHRHNESPERNLQKEVIKWLESIGFSIDCVDSKAQYSEPQGRYISQNAKPGISDLIGNDSNGHAVYIELKAPGRRSTVRSNQREFLLRKIKTNAFAVVADSKEFIQDNYRQWRVLDTETRRLFLLRLLPESRFRDDDKPLFE